MVMLSDPQAIRALYSEPSHGLPPGRTIALRPIVGADSILLLEGAALEVARLPRLARRSLEQRGGLARLPRGAHALLERAEEVRLDEARLRFERREPRGACGFARLLGVDEGPVELALRPERARELDERRGLERAVGALARRAERRLEEGEGVVESSPGEGSARAVEVGGVVGHCHRD